MRGQALRTQGTTPLLLETSWMRVSRPKSIMIVLFAIASLTLTGCSPTEVPTSSDSTPAKTVEVKEEASETKPEKKAKVPAPYQPAPGYKFKGDDPFKK